MEVTLNLPENIYRNFSELAEKKNRRVEDVIADKLKDDFSTEMLDYAETLSSWTDEAVLSLANLKLPKEQASRMSELSDFVGKDRLRRLKIANLKCISKFTTTPIFAKRTELPKPSNAV